MASWWAAILLEHDVEPAELSGGLMKLFIGIWLLLPLDTFDSSPTFAALAIMPEWLWGVALVTLGSAHLAALHTGHQDRRRNAATVGYLVWFSFAVVFVTTNPPAIGWIAFMMAGLAQLWVSVRLGRRA
jgi:hypothetical protein